jgi:hypothetical protein
MTILAASDTIFIEPYFQADEEKRLNHGLVGFEIEFGRSGDVGQIIGPSDPAVHLSHLNFFLKHSIPFEDWSVHKERLTSQFNSLVDLLVCTGEVEKCEAEEVCRALKNL